MNRIDPVTEKWRAAADKAAKTGKMANTLAKALSSRYADRWRFVDFRGPNGGESAGVVDIVAIRKDGRRPTLKGLKALDLFDIILIQVKGGTAALPSRQDIARLRLVKARYHAIDIVLFEWRIKRKCGFQILNAKNRWVPSSAATLFG